MNVFFSGIGGTAIGPLAQIALQAGYSVFGSDKQASQYIDYLKSHGLDNIHIGQSAEQLSEIHSKTPIDWYVYSSAVAIEQPNAPELEFCRANNIKMTKRDEFLNHILEDKKLKLIAVAGTHGKTTTTAMLIWLFKTLGKPFSYSVGAKIPFGDMGHYQEGSEYFIYECDEFDRNFLAFKPAVSAITGVTWDHHEIFPTREDYQQAFRDFINQSSRTFLWEGDYIDLGLQPNEKLCILDAIKESRREIVKEFEREIILDGHFNRLDAALAVKVASYCCDKPEIELFDIINNFPGLQRRMEEIVPGLYSDYAHTPEKIRGAMSVALELAAKNSQQLVVIYEPLTNRRQHFMKDDYKDCFSGAKKVYWVPSYLAREDPNQPVLSPAELISHLANPSIAEAEERGGTLKKKIEDHLANGDMVVAMAGGGGDSLDEWLRMQFKK